MEARLCLDRGLELGKPHGIELQAKARHRASRQKAPGKKQSLSSMQKVAKITQYTYLNRILGNHLEQSLPDLKNKN